MKVLAAAHGNQRWTTRLGEALAGPDAIFMDCAATGDRPERVRQAIAAGKHIHIEKPTAPTVEEAMALARAAHAAGVKHGVIQDKLFLPGFAKLLFVKNSGFFGRICRSASMQGRGCSTARRSNANGRAGTTSVRRAAASRSI